MMIIASESIQPIEIARWFINHIDRAAGEDITHLKLQKLMYYAQAWWLANTGRTLFDEDMQAWTHGPVVPSIWQEFRDYGFGSLPVQPDPNGISEQIGAFLTAIYDKLGKYSAKELERKTHGDQPWVETRGDLPLEAKCEKPIDKTIIRDFYAEKIGKTWGKKTKR